jgi:hypothetical protein
MQRQWSPRRGEATAEGVAVGARTWALASILSADRAAVMVSQVPSSAERRSQSSNAAHASAVPVRNLLRDECETCAKRGIMTGARRRSRSVFQSSSNPIDTGISYKACSLSWTLLVSIVRDAILSRHTA